MRPSALALALPIALSLACSGGGDPIPAGDLPGAARPASQDWGRPASALDLSPDDVASRLGSFEWTAAIEWSVSRQGDDAARVHATERHRIRQVATGEFTLVADVDPGGGPGSETGKEVVYSGGKTFARARYAPFRERATDRGRDARRARDESFASARSLATLLGPALVLTPAGDTQLLGRGARRFAVSLAKAAPGAPAPTAAPTPAAAPPPDEDTRRRRAFLEGLKPLTASGELLLDADSGAPLKVRMTATFAVTGDAKARATVELLAQVKTIGAEVGAIAPPKGALPEERKASGVAAALEAAGLKRRPDEKGDDRKGRGEPGDED